jgi:hypothetical protein
MVKGRGMTATFLKKNCILSLFIIVAAFACRKPEDPIPEPGAVQKFTEILGRPTNSSVTMSILFDRETEVYWEYSTSSGVYSNKTATAIAGKDSPLEFDFTNLAANSQYFYRTRYRAQGASSPFLSGPEHSFHTQRPAGSTFTFAVEADPHLDSNSDTSS